MLFNMIHPLVMRLVDESISGEMAKSQINADTRDWSRAYGITSKKM